MGTQKLQNGVQFTIEWDNVKHSDPIFETLPFKDDLLETIHSTPFPIGSIGYYDDSDNFFIEGEIIRDTKQEVNAEFTIFVARMLKTLRKYYPKAKNINRERVYFKIKPE